MASNLKNEYSPDYVSPPGDSLLESLNAIGMSQTELADRTGRPKKTINEIIKGKAAIIPETAIQFERVLGIPATFWNNRQRRYDEYLAKLKEQERLEKQLLWLKNFPVPKMIKMGWLPESRKKVTRLNNLLNYFGVASSDAWSKYWGGLQVAFRKSKTLNADPFALAAWLRRGELIASTFSCEPYNPKMFRNALLKARSLTVEPPEVFCRKLVEFCAVCGVAVVFVPELPKTASGATRWLKHDKALIQLSLRYKTDDQLWFSFFHEAGHILLHPKRRIFIEGKQYVSKHEEEADKFASEILIPGESYSSFVIRQNFSKKSISNFAFEIGITPGIVVGRLQHDGFLPHSHCNDLKNKLTWVKAA